MSFEQLRLFIFHQFYFFQLGSDDGGTSGRVMAFCLIRPGSKPRIDLDFFQFRIALNLLSLSAGLFLMTCNRITLS